MRKTTSEFTRRRFLQTSVAALGAAALPGGLMSLQKAKAKYTRYNVTSEPGKRALASYARGVEKMLSLPPDHPQNWFHNAFIHLMDCPHGNWWFYVWHRGYLGYFEETIRNLSGDSEFAIPYWDWTTLPRIPESMFQGPLTPTSKAFEPYTCNLWVFAERIQPAMQKYWNSLNSDQLNQLKIRGYDTFDKMWNDVNGNGDAGNIAYAFTSGARYPTPDNPDLKGSAAKDVEPFIILTGLLAPEFYNDASKYLSFNSSKTASHNTQPNSSTVFSVLEGLPHNNVHNYIGGVYNGYPGPYGNMTNFLSPVDPIFFLHHSNMDRLWDVWTRKQQLLGLPYLPTGSDLDTLSKEPFLFFVDGEGQYVTYGHAGDYLSTERFQYDYAPGFGDKEVTGLPAPAPGLKQAVPLKGVVTANTAQVTVPAEAVKKHLASLQAASLVAEVTVPYPSAGSPGREFDVLVGAPADVKRAEPGSPYYAGTIAFFGNMAHMGHAGGEATFIVPLPSNNKALSLTAGAKTASFNIRVVPAYGRGKAPAALKAVTVRSL